MASNYAGFAVMYETTKGVPTRVGSGVSVKCRKAGAGSDLAESPLTTNSDGEIVSGSFASVTAGSTVYFRVENYNGLAFSISQITT